MFQKQKSRQKNFKKGVDEADSRRRREEAAVDIRKNKRMDALQKRRKDDGDANSTVGVNPTAAAPQLSLAELTLRLDPSVLEKLPLLPEWTAKINSNDPLLQYEATSNFRKLLSIERNPPIQHVIEQGVVPRIVQFLHAHENRDLQFEAAWAITNVASGSPQQTRVVIDNNAVPILVQLLSSPSEDVREQAVWAIGNIAGDSPLCRDLVLSYGALDPILHILSTSTRNTMLRNATWTLSNFCRGKPFTDLSVVIKSLPVLNKLVFHTDEDVIADACWALSYISDSNNERIQHVLDSGVVRRVVELLMHPNAAVQTPALRCIGNIVTGDDLQTQWVIRTGALPFLLALLSSSKKNIRKEACWTISNITAGNKQQIQEVISNGFVPPLVHILNTADYDVKKEAAWAISNACTGGNREQINFLVGHRIIKPMCELLTVTDPKIVVVALDCLENILRVGKEVNDDNPYAIEVEENDGLDEIMKLQRHPNKEVYKKAHDILDNYFQDDSESDDDAEAGPGVQTNNGGVATYQFGIPMNQQPFSFQPPQ